MVPARLASREPSISETRLEKLHTFVLSETASEISAYLSLTSSVPKFGASASFSFDLIDGE